ncbi:MAG: C69 family dipeptidase [Myxococcota bacterium]
MCDSVVAVGSQTATGVTLFGKNSDRKRRECQPLVQHAGAWHPPDARQRCTHVEIPQVAETFRTLGHSPDWVWGYEHGVNEHAVAIGNHTVFSQEPVEETPGLIGMDLVRLGLERGRSAREALGVITALLEAHGQGGNALAPDGAGYHNSFLLADAHEAWVLETSNRRWAARRTDLAACSNHFGLTDDWEIRSGDLESFAREAGWWSGDGRLDVAAAYRNPHVPPRISEGRHRAARAALAAGSGTHDLASFQRLLSDHGDGGPVWTAVDATPDEERFFTVCAHSDPVHWTTASLVAPLPEATSAPWPVYASFGTPCTGFLLPVYVAGVLPARLAGCGADDAWPVFSRLNDAVAKDPVRRTPAVRRAFAPLEARVERERVEVEREAAAAADADEASVLVSRFMERSVDAVLGLAGEIEAGL